MYPIRLSVIRSVYLRKCTKRMREFIWCQCRSVPEPFGIFSNKILTSDWNKHISNCLLTVYYNNKYIVGYLINSLIQAQIIILSLSYLMGDGHLWGAFFINLPCLILLSRTSIVKLFTRYPTMYLVLWYDGWKMVRSTFVSIIHED